MNNLNGTETNSAAMLNIKAVVKQTGLNPATLRAWERRYGFPTPHRTDGGHRQYSQHDIDVLKWLIARQEEGISISHAIDLWRSYDERGEDPLQTETTRDKATQVAPYLEGRQLDELRQAWVSACLALDREAAEQILAFAFAQYAPETVCLELLQFGLAEVGNGWYEGTVSVQQEHFTTALTNQRLEMLIAAAPSPSRRERIISLCAPGDYHVFSSLLLTFLLRRQGFDVVYFGADVPAEELASTIKKVAPTLAIVSAQRLHGAAGLKDIALDLHSVDIKIAFGGLTFNQMPRLRELIPGHFLGETIQGSVETILQIIANKLPEPEPIAPSDSYLKALSQFRERQALIETHVWGTFIATNKPTRYLAKINNDIGQFVDAALNLGDMTLLESDITRIEYLLTSYRPPKQLVIDYLQAYHQGARIHLGDSASMVLDWFSLLLSQESEPA
ncbi:MAG: MerR family transcriptional regulator [Candidatus Promineifilaceae bacterium]